MRSVVPAEGAVLDRILATHGRSATASLGPHARRQFAAAQLKTPWGRSHQQRTALVDGDQLLASATRCLLAGILDGRPVHICAIGEVGTDPGHDGADAAQTLVDQLFIGATEEGADLGLLFVDRTSTWPERSGLEEIPTTEVELGVAHAANHGAPMTLVRGGEERDLAAIVAMGRTRSAPFRFHLDRDVDLVQHAITRKRLLAGLAPSGSRQLQFFIAEEGITAAAYIVISTIGSTWTIEECGDRDASGARVGAILQALIARQPIEQRPTIRGWLPPGFVPPQVTIVSAAPSSEVLLMRSLGSPPLRLRIAGDEVLYWRSDAF